MVEEHRTVFISYRRNVASFIARAIFMDLRKHRYDVFMDVEAIDSGEFDRIILNQIEARAHFVLILTPGTLERCVEPNDWLRREIEYAMEKQRNIVPLFANEFKYNDETAKYLTGSLIDLPRLNGLNLPHDFFDEAMGRLRRRYLKQPVYGVVKSAPSIEQPTVQQKIDNVAAQPAPTQQQLSAEQFFHRAFARDKLDYLGKIADYSEVLRLNPEDALAFNNRGEAYFADGKFDEALKDFQRANNFRPAYAMTLGGLAITYYKLGKKNEAKRIWQILLAQAQGYHDADWVGKELNWHPTLTEAARKLIAEL